MFKFAAWKLTACTYSAEEKSIVQAGMRWRCYKNTLMVQLTKYVMMNMLKQHVYTQMGCLHLMFVLCFSPVEDLAAIN